MSKLVYVHSTKSRRRFLVELKTISATPARHCGQPFWSSSKQSLQLDTALKLASGLVELQTIFSTSARHCIKNPRVCGTMAHESFQSAALMRPYGKPGAGSSFVGSSNDSQHPLRHYIENPEQGKINLLTGNSQERGERPRLIKLRVGSEHLRNIENAARELSLPRSTTRTNAPRLECPIPHSEHNVSSPPYCIE